MFPGTCRSTFALNCWTIPRWKSLGCVKKVPLNAVGLAVEVSIGNPWEIAKLPKPEGDDPSTVAQYDVAKGHPLNPGTPACWAKPRPSDSAKKGGFCQSPCAPMLQAESWKMA